MNSDNFSPHIYPAYCNVKSPTIHKFCPLRAVDVHALSGDQGYYINDRPLFHHGNHQILWVMLTGLVVAVDEYYGKTIFTIDDSSGMCIECTAPTPKANLPIEPVINQKHKIIEREEANTTRPTPATPKIPWGDMDVGVVVKIKGRINTFRNQKQIEIVKIEILRSTDQEVSFWDYVLAFRQRILSIPWTLTQEEEDKCRRQATGERQSKRKEKTESRLGMTSYKNKMVNDENRNPNVAKGHRNHEAKKKRRETEEQEKTNSEVQNLHQIEHAWLNSKHCSSLGIEARERKLDSVKV
ncbi:hypothetical protein HYFRA_00012048 [Hymenoscyphus fraxineus]|uniref:CST complex subunit Stn1 N-terminal domain-containing protein n=1 Tax=Hymenoscyphus fraxineus TaxID=746836 RepID=A0A9N9L003_9HELO|nr:hypothetical protein HYFRA_00012048 [Hymenoscyphus fraxineus]